MAKLTFEITMSLDGFVAGPNPTLEQPLGEGGDRLHQWAYGLRSWRESHGLEGGEENPDSDLLAESIRNNGAILMGRKMFSGGEGTWEDDPRAQGWWGDDPPFRVPVFVLTHHAREPLSLGETTFYFVTDGIGSALEQAREAAGPGNVAIAGGASVAQQYLCAGLLNEMQIHLAPILLGGGVRLFEDLGDKLPGLELARVIESPAATHVSYRVSN